MKIATAAFGALLTLFFGSWAAAFVVAGVKWLPEPSAFVHLAIGLGALVGGGAFWVWVLGCAPITSRRRRALTLCLACGICAALAVVVSFSVRASFELNVLSSALLLSILVGIGVITALWLPIKKLS